MCCGPTLAIFNNLLIVDAQKYFWKKKTSLHSECFIQIITEFNDDFDDFDDFDH